MNHKLNMAAAKGAMKIVLSKTHVDAAKALGCTEKEWTLLTGQAPWKGNDRNVIKRLLDNIMYGMMDTMNLPRFQVPAEYIASIITGFVARCNYFAACNWLENTYKAEDLGNYDGSQKGEMEKVSDSRLFALVCAIESDEEVDAIAKEFSRKTKIQIGYLPEVVTNET